MSSLSPTAGETESIRQPTTGVLLIQLGTPREPKRAAVRRFLREFLSDERVIDVAAPLRFFLVNGVIAPFRTPGSTKIYRTLWELGGGEKEKKCLLALYVHKLIFYYLFLYEPV